MDQNGNIVKAHIPNGGSIPSGYRDIEAGLQIDEDTAGLSTDLLEVAETPQVDFVAGEPENWIKDEEVVYDVNDIPTLVDENDDPYLDPDWVHVDAVDEIPHVPAFFTLKKKSSADQSLREAKMAIIRSKREPLLAEADIEINKLEDTAGDSSSWRTYRQALRDITSTYKKVDGDWKVAVDALDAETYEFPAKPE